MRRVLGLLTARSLIRFSSDSFMRRTLARPLYCASYLAPSKPSEITSSAPEVTTPDPEPTNQHFSVDPEGRECVDLTFASEPLGLPAAEGYGWAQFEFGESIGPEDNPERYTILRKLGWGMHSSTWLARDNVYVLNSHLVDLY